MITSRKLNELVNEQIFGKIGVNPQEPNYCFDIKEAYKIVEHFKSYSFSMYNEFADDGVVWYVSMGPKNDLIHKFISRESSLPLAIVRSALLSVTSAEKV